ncbi:SgcJ/EcaC family oxidoreductase [Spirosoma sp. KNUC1025]|uniref:SgcJ/EcaC family oxidoreductase n=1 Tax=Spirosoma sp. KNUC1025 TaxID=2894082 RepID=UPI001E572374|nr:SgcJ/EcaC family oxidoreductase [Spirosoma sp. KNUC1025]UFH57865.1 SgcJ/EcaC family oxidoreductase [Spirosoma sp. KNUC1025]
MKTFLYGALLLLLFTPIYGQPKAFGLTDLDQKKKGDQQAIERQMDASFTSWNHHDFSDMNKYIAPACDFVTIVGMHWKGRADIQYAHQVFHKISFGDIPLAKRAVSIRFVTPDVAIAHVLMHVMKAYTAPDGSKAGDNDASATFVFIKRSGVWLVEAVENVVVNEGAQAGNPITIRNQSKK